MLRECCCLVKHSFTCLQIVCNLACIEIIMQLEDKQLEDEVLDNSELLVACYFIIESAVSYMAGSTSQVLVCWN